MPASHLRCVAADLKDFHLWKAVRTEYLGTTLMILVGCGACIDWWPDKQLGQQTLKIGLAFGLSVASLVQATGHISGGHLSPAVTLAWLVTRKVTVVRAVLYVVAQCAGAVTGAAMLYGVTPPNIRKGQLGVTKLHHDVRQVQGFGVEFLATFTVVYTLMATVDGKRQDLGSRPLAIGLVVTAAHLFALEYTGASLNPARSLGPALIMNEWSDHWVYWVGPLLGGILAGFTYEYTEDSATSFDSIKPTFKDKSRYLFTTAVNWPHTHNVNGCLTDGPVTELTAVGDGQSGLTVEGHSRM